MKLRIGLVAAALVLGLSGCMDLDLSMFDDDDSAAATVAAPNGCTAQGCPQAPQFCQARGYTPGTDGYERCLVSVNENLRKGQ